MTSRTKTSAELFAEAAEAAEAEQDRQRRQQDARKTAEWDETDAVLADVERFRTARDETRAAFKDALGNEAVSLDALYGLWVAARVAAAEFTGTVGAVDGLKGQLRPLRSEMSSQPVGYDNVRGLGAVDSLFSRPHGPYAEWHRVAQQHAEDIVRRRAGDASVAVTQRIRAAGDAAAAVIK